VCVTIESAEARNQAPSPILDSVCYKAALRRTGTANSSLQAGLRR
jgi:hypothetical protein